MTNGTKQTHREFTVTCFVRDGKMEDVNCTVKAFTPAQAAKRMANLLCKQLYNNDDCTVELTLNEMQNGNTKKTFIYRAIRESIAMDVHRGNRHIQFKHRVRVISLNMKPDDCCV